MNVKNLVYININPQRLTKDCFLLNKTKKDTYVKGPLPIFLKGYKKNEYYPIVEEAEYTNHEDIRTFEINEDGSLSLYESDDNLKIYNKYDEYGIQVKNKKIDNKKVEKSPTKVYKK